MTLFDGSYDVKLNAWNFKRLLAQKYDVVVTNPPYMGSKGMDGKLVDYLSEYYHDSKSDMSTVFMTRTLEMCKHSGIMAMINIPVWMSKSSFERLRYNVLSKNTFCNVLHFGRGIFGSDFGTVAFVLYKERIARYKGVFFQLFDQLGAVDNINIKERWFFEKKNKYIVNQEHFLNIFSYPIAYWVSLKILDILEEVHPLQYYADARKGLTTGDNDTFMRLWFEISQTNFSIYSDNAKWFPMTKGGDFRRWYGNNEYVVNWYNDGFEICNFKDEKGKLRSRPQNVKYYFREGISWNDTTATGKIAFRYQDSHYIPNASGPCVYCDNRDRLMYLFALLNSCVSQCLLEVLAPNMKFEVGQMALVPTILDERTDIRPLIDMNLSIARTDWDSFETSWDFQVHPLVKFQMASTYAWRDEKPTSRISSAFKAWETFTEGQFVKLKANEEELNRIFIEIYGLQDELTPEVEDKDVTIRKADLSRDIRSFISYAVGCMFGRYSLDEPGLVFAGGQFDMARYKTFLPEDDNILPIGASDYFDDDIVVRFVDFVRVVYGDATLDENLNFIADALYPNGGGSSKEKIRRYFLNDFYKDHVKTYQKRPIYWLFDSGKKDGFKALIYLHRYDKFTVARVRTDYLHPLQRKYESEIGRLEMLSGITENAREKAAYRKEIESLHSKIEECRIYDQVVAHIAHQAIELDLDDGVKVNYAKFQGVEVPKDNGKTVKMDLLAKI